MVDRIQKIINWKKLTLSGFADQIGVPRSTISHIISGRNNPSLDLVQKILDTFPEIKTEWLVRGTGSMYSHQSSLFDEHAFDDPNDYKSQEKKSSISGVEQIKNEPATIKNQEHIPQNTAHDQAGDDQRTGKNSSEGDIKQTENSKKDTHTTSRILVLHTNGTFTEYLPSER